MLNITPLPDEEYIKTLASFLFQNVKKHQDLICMAYNGEDVERNLSAGKMSAVLTMEEGRAVDGKLENLKRFYDIGFRALSLTGLTPFGREAVSYMQELGMLVDVSHLSEGGFYDVADICKKPFAATHSNCTALCPHPRNLTDDQIRVLGNAGGVTGINFAPEFLNEDMTSKTSTAARMAMHARHIADVGGVECVGIGSDLDGIFGNLEISDCSKMQLLADALEKEGFTGSEIEKIFYRNVLRVMKDSMK